MLNLQLELFILLAIGYYCGKKVFDSHTRNQLTDLVINVILPCSILSSFTTSIDASLASSSIQVLMAAFLIQVFYFVCNIFLYKKLSVDKQICCKYSTMVTNASFIGIPIASSIYGQQGVILASIFVLPQRIFMWLLGLPMFSEQKVRGKEIVLKVLFHPCVSSVLLGIVIMFIYSNGITLPSVIIDTISAIGKCNLPLCLFIIGAIISDLDLKEMKDKDALLFSILRLIVFPIIILLILKFLSFDLLSIKISVLLSGMPIPTTTVILAEKYHKDAKFASKLMIYSTILSMLTIPIITKVIELF